MLNESRLLRVIKKQGPTELLFENKLRLNDFSIIVQEAVCSQAHIGNSLSKTFRLILFTFYIFAYLENFDNANNYQV